MLWVPCDHFPGINWDFSIRTLPLALFIGTFFLDLWGWESHLRVGVASLDPGRWEEGRKDHVQQKDSLDWQWLLAGETSADQSWFVFLLLFVQPSARKRVFRGKWSGGSSNLLHCTLSLVCLPGFPRSPLTSCTMWRLTQAPVKTRYILILNKTTDGWNIRKKRTVFTYCFH